MFLRYHLFYPRDKYKTNPSISYLFIYSFIVYSYFNDTSPNFISLSFVHLPTNLAHQSLPERLHYSKVGYKLLISPLKVLV